MKMPPRFVDMKMPPGLIRLIGRRGACLLALGVIDIFIGWSVWIAPQSPLTLLKHIPTPVLGMTWILAGVIAIASIRRKYQDSWGFIGCWQVPFIWGCLFIAELVFPLNNLGIWPGIRAIVTYWGYAALILVISGWPEGSIVIHGHPKGEGQYIAATEGPNNVDLGDDS